MAIGWNRADPAPSTPALRLGRIVAGANPPRAPRRPRALRAGTVLDHRFCQRIAAPSGRDGRYRLHGMLDRRQRVYQAGGETGNFFFWKSQPALLSLDLDVWRQIAPQVDTIEMVDHGRNEVWVVDVICAQLGQTYEAGIGSRWGVPMPCCQLVQADGVVRQARTCGHRPNEGGAA